MVLGQLDIHMQNNKVKPLSDINSKCTKDLSSRVEMSKTCRKNISVSLCYLGLSNDLSVMTPKTQQPKEKKYVA